MGSNSIDKGHQRALTSFSFFWGFVLVGDVPLSGPQQVVHVDIPPVDMIQELPVAAQLSQPHHDGEDVSVIPHQGASAYVFQDDLATLVHPGVVHRPLLPREL